MAHAGHGMPDFLSEFGQRMTADVEQFDMLQIVPDTLHRMEFRRVAREPEQRDAAGRATAQKILHGAIMNRGAIPHDEQLPGEVA